MRATGIRLVGGLAVTALVTALTVAVAAQTPASQTPALPPAVQKAFQQAFPRAVIAGTSQERTGGTPAFRIQSVDSGRRRIVLYDAAGTTIEVAEQVYEKELPKPVAAAMYSHPRAIYVSGMKVTRGSNVQYELTLRGTRKTAMIAKPDGTVVSFK